MVRHVRRVVTIALGVFFLLLGIIGGFLPIIQGWIFVLIGLTLLAKEVPLVRHKLDALRRRYPKQADQLHRLKEKWCSGRASSRSDETSGTARR